MSTPPQPPGAKSSGPTSDDRTRDIRLPSLPDRPPAAVRPEWQSHVRPGTERSEAAVPASAGPDAGAPDPADPPTAQPTVASERTSSAPPATKTVRLQQPSPEELLQQPDTISGQPTDKLSSPSPVRQQTLPFDAPAGGSPGSAPSRAPFPDFAAPPPNVPRPAPVPSRPRPGAGAPSHGSPTNGARPAPARQRRWPWVVLVLLPILVIAIAGALLFLLLGGA